MQNKKEHRAKMLEIIIQWQQSGLTQRSFCATTNIAYHVFHYWYGLYRSQQNAPGSFLPLNVTTSVNQEQIIVKGVNGIQVLLPFTDQSVGFVRQLLLSCDAAS